MKKVHTNWLLYDPIKSKKILETSNESMISSEEIMHKIKLIEKAFR
jgi:hypothetical protein